MNYFSYGSDVSKCSLECIESVAMHYGSTPSLHTLTPLTHSLQHFLKVRFTSIYSVCVCVCVGGGGLVRKFDYKKN